MESAPHQWLFPRCCAVIHHGGAGTTSAALRAGSVSVILPLFFDQAFWGRWLVTHDLGPAPIPFRKLSADRLLRALNAAEEPGLRVRVARLGRRLRREDGAALAVQAIDEALAARISLARKTG